MKLREAISLAPRLQPGDKISRNDAEPFRTVYLIHPHKKPFKRFRFLSKLSDHRAEAPVLMRSLRVTMLLFDWSPAAVLLQVKAALWLCRLSCFFRNC
jgi:hypothetical protein